MTQDLPRRPLVSWRAEQVEWPVLSLVGPGLDGAVATETAVAWLDGVGGQLYYRDLPFEDLAGRLTFEAVAFLLLTGVRPLHHDTRWRRFQRLLLDGLATPSEVETLTRSLPQGARPLEQFRLGVSALGCLPRAEAEPPPRLLGRLAGLLIALVAGRSEPPPRTSAHDPGSPTGSLSGCLLGAMTRTEPSPAAIAAFDLTLVAYADDGLEPLTFAGLVVESCLADRYAALCATLSAANGPWATGVVSQLVDLMDRCPHADAARGWVRATLATGGRLPGFGHRILRGGDPRVPILAARFAAVAESHGARRLLQIVEAIAGEARGILSPKGIEPNVNLYGAPLLRALGVPASLVPCIIVFARCAGLMARLEEYVGTGRIFRPLDEYIGPAPRPFRPLESR